MALKKWSIYLLILCAPLLLMVMVNEVSRKNISEKPHQFQGFTTINSVHKIKTKCTWICHYETDYCKKNHVKLVRPWFATTDTAYFGVIRTLESTESYNLANILLFLVLIPLFMWVLIIQILRMQREIRTFKHLAND